MPGYIKYMDDDSGRSFVFRVNDGLAHDGSENLPRMSVSDLAQLRAIIGPLLQNVENMMESQGYFQRYTDKNATPM